MIFCFHRGFVLSSLVSSLLAKVTSPLGTAMPGTSIDSTRETLGSVPFLEHDMGDAPVLGKRAGDTRTIEQCVDALIEKMDSLGLHWMMEYAYFDKLKEEGLKEEKRHILGVHHKEYPGELLHETNLGFVAYEREDGNSASTRIEGEMFTGVTDSVFGRSMVNMIHGHSDFRREDVDSVTLIDQMYHSLSDSFSMTEHQEEPEKFINEAWSETKQRGVGYGCLAIMLAIINEHDVIQIANVGQSWAGLYRNGEFIHETELKLLGATLEYEMCLLRSRNELFPITRYETDTYTWQAQEGDWLILVSGGVRRRLEPHDIISAFGTIRRLGPAAKPFENADDFTLLGMDIVRAAKDAKWNSREQDDMMAAVVKIGGNSNRGF